MTWKRQLKTYPIRYIIRVLPVFWARMIRQLGLTFSDVIRWFLFLNSNFFFRFIDFLLAILTKQEEFRHFLLP